MGEGITFLLNSTFFFCEDQNDKLKIKDISRSNTMPTTENSHPYDGNHIYSNSLASGIDSNLDPMFYDMGDKSMQYVTILIFCVPFKIFLRI